MSYAPDLFKFFVVKYILIKITYISEIGCTYLKGMFPEHFVQLDAAECLTVWRAKFWTI